MVRPIFVALGSLLLLHHGLSQTVNWRPSASKLRPERRLSPAEAKSWIERISLEATSAAYAPAVPVWHLIEVATAPREELQAFISKGKPQIRSLAIAEARVRKDKELSPA